jgi:hypothetical protein
VLCQKSRTIREGGTESRGSVRGEIPLLPSHGVKADSRVAEVNGDPAFFVPLFEKGGKEWISLND